MQYPMDLDVTPELAELAAARAELEARGIFVMPAAAETELSGRWAVRSRPYGLDTVEAVVLAGSAMLAGQCILACNFLYMLHAA